jgi:hypothetical protein
LIVADFGALQDAVLFVIYAAIRVTARLREERASCVANGAPPC